MIYNIDNFPITIITTAVCLIARLSKPGASSVIKKKKKKYDDFIGVERSTTMKDDRKIFINRVSIDFEFNFEYFK